MRQLFVGMDNRHLRFARLALAVAGQAAREQVRAGQRGEPAGLPPALEGRDGHVNGEAQVGRGAYRQASQAVQALLRGLVYNVHRVIVLNTS